MFNSKKEKLFVIFDVGNATVSAGLVQLKKGSKPLVLATFEAPVSISESFDQASSETKIFDLIGQAAKYISDEGLKSAHNLNVKFKELDHVFVSFASPWYAAKASRIVIRKEDAFILDEETIREAVLDQEKKFESDAILGLYPNLKDKDIRMVERSLIAVKLNGYETVEPFGKVAKDAELYMYMSLIPEDLIQKAKIFINKNLHDKLISYHTFPLIFLWALRKIFPLSRDYLLVDITGKSTDMAVVRSGVIEHSTSFPSGRNAIFNSIMKNLGVTEEIAHSHLHLYQTKSAEAGLQSRLAQIVEDCGTKWAGQFNDAITKTVNGSVLPHTCFIVTNDEVLANFSNQIRLVGVALGISKIFPISQAILAEHIEYGKYVKPNQLIALEVLSILDLNEKN